MRSDAPTVEFAERARHARRALGTLMGVLARVIRAGGGACGAHERGGDEVRASRGELGGAAAAVWWMSEGLALYQASLYEMLVGKSIEFEDGGGGVVDLGPGAFRGEYV